MTNSAPTLAALLLIGLSGQAVAEIDLDCRAESSDCPEVVIEGDPFAEVLGIGPSPFRGYGDPSVRKDPGSDRLWMTYSYLDVHISPEPETAVSIHLASSDDGGVSWRFRKRLERSRAEFYPDDEAQHGVSVHEVSTLSPLLTGSKVQWFGLHLRYFDPFGPEPRRPESFHFSLVRSKKPKRLAKKRESRMAGPLVDPAWGTNLDLSALDSELESCSVWTEPSLLATDETLFLVAQCIVIELSTGERRAQDEFLGVFASDGQGKIRSLDWKWMGKLTNSTDAETLGGEVLTQPDLAWSRDGRLLLIVTPKKLAPTELHMGCRVLEVESLEEPRLARAAGRPLVRADIRSSDSSGLGPGLCAYDAASETGVLFVRTEIDAEAPDVVFRLHATGIHP